MQRCETESSKTWKHDDKDENFELLVQLIYKVVFHLFFLVTC